MFRLLNRRLSRLILYGWGMTGNKKEEEGRRRNKREKEGMKSEKFFCRLLLASYSLFSPILPFYSLFKIFPLYPPLQFKDNAPHLFYHQNMKSCEQ